MRLYILSDLHLEFGEFIPVNVECDVVILAGDIHVGKKAISWIKKNFPDKPVLYVLGNHEYYGKAYPKLLSDIKIEIGNSNIHLLENSFFEFENFLFFGCTLWTDFQITGDFSNSVFDSSQKMNDFKKIRVSPAFRKFRPSDAIAIHKESVRILKNTNTSQAKELIVITHHAPHIKSSRAGFESNSINGAYVSDLTDLIFEIKPKIWIHGHTHVKRDYYIGETRIVSNPRGYVDEPVPGFEPDYIIEI